MDDVNSTESLQYEFNTVEVATNHFSDSNKIGEGGFGAVYKVRTEFKWVFTYQKGQYNTSYNTFCKTIASLKLSYLWRCMSIIIGHTTKWSRNSCEEAVSGFKSRTTRIQK